MAKNACLAFLETEHWQRIKSLLMLRVVKVGGGYLLALLLE